MVGICRRFFGAGADYQDQLEAQASFDGGVTWQTTLLPLDSPFSSISDPWIGIAPNGNVYVIALPVTSGSAYASAAVCCYTSTDGGQTFPSPVFILTGGTPDNTFGAVDDNSRLYAAWNDGENSGTLGFAWSLDGVNWAPSASAQTQYSQYDLPVQGFNYVNMAVSYDGSIHIIGNDGSGNMSYARSKDHGSSFEFGAIASNQSGVGDIDNIFEALEGSTNPNTPVLAVRNPPAVFAVGDGLLFAAWSVDIGSTATNPIPVMRICVASCSDNGDQWVTNTSATAPQEIPLLPICNLSQTPQDQYFRPRLAGMPNGTVGCLFSYLQVLSEAPAITTQLSTCLSASLPNSSSGYFAGNSTTTVVVSDQATSPFADNPVLRWGGANNYFIGDFIGLAANASGFFPYWSDTRNGTAQIMTCSVPVLPTFPWTGAALAPPSGVQFVPGTLVVITDANGCLEVFAVNQADGNVWNAFQQSPGGGWNWASDNEAWHALPPVPTGVSFVPNPSPYGPLQSPAVVLRSGQLEVFAISSTGQPFRATQNGFGAVNGWGPWTAMTAPPGNMWSISAMASGGFAVVTYSTDQGAFYDLGGPPFGLVSIPEFWLGPQPGPTNVGVNIIRTYPYAGSIIGMLLGSPETFYYSQFIDLIWTQWQTGPSGPGPGTATLQDYRIAYLIQTGLEIYGVRRFDGNLIFSINGINGVTSWTNFITLNDGPFQYGVFDVAALPQVQGPQSGEFEAFTYQYNCVFLTDASGGVLQILPVLGSNGNLTYQPFGPFALDNNSDCHFGAITTLAVGVNQDTRLEVFALEPTNQCFHWWQSNPDPQLQDFNLPGI